MSEKINNFIKWLQGSADNKPGGASSKKLSAFWAIVIMGTLPEIFWMIWAFRKGDWSLLPTILGIILTFAAAALGINAVEKIKGKANVTEESNAQQ